MDIFFLLMTAGLAVLAARTYLRNASSGGSRTRGDPRRRHRSVNTWRQAAKELRLGYQPETPRSPRVISGHAGDFEVVVTAGTRTLDGREAPFTRYRVTYPRPLDLGLRLSRETGLAGVARHLGEQDVELGDASFDEAVMVRASDVDRVRSFLGPGRRMRCRRLLELYPGAIIADGGITWTVPGLVEDPQEIVSVVRRMLHVGRHLAGEPAEDRKIDRALRARQKGRLDEAVKLVRDLRVDDPEDTAEKTILEAEILLVAGRRDEARKALSRDGAPRGGLALLERPPPLPARPEEPPPLPARADRRPRDAGHAVTAESPKPRDLEGDAAPEEAEAGSSPEDSRPASRDDGRGKEPLGGTEAGAAGALEDRLPGVSEPLSAPVACNRLFDPGLLSVDSRRIFEESFEGRLVAWSGVLEKVESYPFDFVFGDRPGTKATIALCEIEAPVYGTRKVTAIVDFPADAAEALAGRIGEEVAFEGRLRSIDGFVNNLYIAEGALESVPAR